MELEEFGGSLSMPTEPTPYRPGTAGKVKTMEQRHATRQLHHPKDANLDDVPDERLIHDLLDEDDEDEDPTHL
jgi:hypothetical protein